VIGWTDGMRAWFALTAGDYRGVIRAAETSEPPAPGTRAAVQLASQRGKASTSIGDRRQVEVALDQGRALLERMPYPDNVDNHFAVDPAKWDLYADGRLSGTGRESSGWHPEPSSKGLCRGCHPTRC
jgi:hypothetical protein